MDEETNGGVVINLQGVESKLQSISESLKSDNKALFIECAMRLFTYTNFEEINKSPTQVAIDAINRASVFVTELNKSLK